MSGDDQYIPEPSIRDILPDSLHKHYDKIPPDWFDLSEDELKKIYDERLEQAKTKNTFGTDQQVRISFWREFHTHKKERRRFMISKVVDGIIAPSVFFQRLAPSPQRLAWVLCPPGDMEVIFKDQALEAVKVMKDILSAPRYLPCQCHRYCVCKPHGYQELLKQGITDFCACKPKCACPPRLDVKTVELQAKYTDFVVLRAEGSIAQVVKSQNLNVNLNRDQNEREALPLPEDLAGIEKQNRELSERLGKLPPAQTSLSDTTTQVIEAEIVENKKT